MCDSIVVLADIHFEGVGRSPIRNCHAAITELGLKSDGSAPHGLEVLERELKVTTPKRFIRSAMRFAVTVSALTFHTSKAKHHKGRRNATDVTPGGLCPSSSGK